KHIMAVISLWLIVANNGCYQPDCWLQEKLVKIIFDKNQMDIKNKIAACFLLNNKIRENLTGYDPIKHQVA
ncbi:MAG TPA: hypothetical protein PKW44_06785, partial [Methylophilaceae bacterium]|nr:hypothetical protein [Methylophilaceae bacterium]